MVKDTLSCLRLSPVNLNQTRSWKPRSEYHIQSPYLAPFLETKIRKSGRLDVSIVWNRLQTLNTLQLDCSRISRHGRLSLELHALALLLGFLSLLGVLLDSVQELVSRPGVGDVLYSDVDALLKVSVADLLVDDDADGGLGYVVDDAGFAVVDLEWHTLLDGSVDFDIYDVTDPEFVSIFFSIGISVRRAPHL